MTHAYDESLAYADSRAVALNEPVPTWQPVVVTAPPAEPRTDPARRRLAGLDGLRAVAVLAVVVFHLDFSLAPGGFLGVDVFFVISGLLITNMVAEEIIATGRLRLRRFYVRRARRLLPAVLAMLAVVSVAGATVWRDQLATLKSGVAASLGYVTNWWLIADDQSYFASAGRPPMVQHLWSLAIEEQFYLVWSVAIVLIVGVAARRIDPVARVRLAALIALLLAVASTATMWVIANRSGLPYFGNTSRVYFGSDTHSMGLFLGSACGAWLAVRRRGAPVRGNPRLPAKLAWLTDVVGAVLIFVLIDQFFSVTEFSPRLYRGGFLLFDTVALAVILCALRRRSLLGRILDMRPVKWVGQRSYSIYIWHWPVAEVTRPDLDVRGPVFLINLCRLALILGLAALSYHFIEVPLRSGNLARWRSERNLGDRRRWDTAAVLTTLIAAASLGAASSAVGSPAPPEFVTRLVPSTTPDPMPVTRPGGAPSSSRTAAPPTRQGSRPVPAARTLRISAFGDSVLLGASPALRAVARRLDVDAVEGRQPYQVLDDVLSRARAGRLEPDVLIHTGNNGILSPDQLRQTLAALRGRARVVLVTDRVARDWQDPNNATITAVAKGFPNVVVLDWHDLSAGRRSWLYSDGLHLTPAGARAYAQLIRAAFRGH